MRSSRSGSASTKSDDTIKRYGPTYVGSLPEKMARRVLPFKVTEGHRNRQRLIGCSLEVMLIQNISRVSKNAPTLASCSFDKHGLIFLIVFSKQHQHTFRNDVPI